MSVYVCYWTHFTSVQESQYFCDLSISGQLKQLHFWESECFAVYFVRGV